MLFANLFQLFLEVLKNQKSIYWYQVLCFLLLVLKQEWVKAAIFIVHHHLLTNESLYPQSLWCQSGSTHFDGLPKFRYVYLNIAKFNHNLAYLNLPYFKDMYSSVFSGILLLFALPAAHFKNRNSIYFDYLVHLLASYSILIISQKSFCCVFANQFNIQLFQGKSGFKYKKN